MRFRKLGGLLAAVMIVGAGIGMEGRAGAGEADAVIREPFDTLEAWKPLHFAKIERLSRYGVESEGGNRVLRAEAVASASAIVHKAHFAVRAFPLIRWRWKIENILETGDAKTKAGDDYPIRVYVIFEYDPDKASFGQRIKYGAAKAIYGEYPPHSSLNYIWANRPYPEAILPNTYTDRAQMFLLEKGAARAGQWIEEARNILEDYRRAFGEEPPENATVAIMADTDTTGEKVTAWVDDLVVFSAP